MARSYYSAFWIAILICLSPIKPLAYAAPFLAVCWLLCASGNRDVLMRAGLALLSVAGVFTAYYLLFPKYIFLGGFLATVTYGTFFFLVIVPVKRIADEKLLERMTELIGKVLLVEASFGILQGLVEAYRSGSFDTANGDAVEGTIHLAFGSDNAFGNPMFAANLCFMLLAILPCMIEKKRAAYVPFVLGGIAFVMASVMHMIILFTISVIFALCVFRPPIPVYATKRRLMAAAFLVPLLTVGLLGNNLRSLPDLASGLFNGELPKSQIVDRAIFEMPEEYPAMPFVGLGAGQFSSRASLITTGLYFGGLSDPTDLPFLKGQQSEPVEDYLFDLWVASSRYESGGGGSTTRPFFSWLSVYTEFGAPVFLGIFIYVLVLLMRLRAKAVSPRQKWLAVSVGTGIVFLLLIGFQENYWEVPQAILIGVMMLQVMYANIVHGSAPLRQSANPLATAEGGR